MKLFNEVWTFCYSKCQFYTYQTEQHENSYKVILTSLTLVKSQQPGVALLGAGVPGSLTIVTTFASCTKCGEKF